MLRTLIFALAVATPGLAAAEQFPQSAVGAEVRGDDGAVIGHVTAVQRDRHGNVIAVEIPGGEPPDAASVTRPVLVAQNDDRHMRVVDMRGSERSRGTSNERVLLR